MEFKPLSTSTLHACATCDQTLDAREGERERERERGGGEHNCQVTMVSTWREQVSKRCKTSFCFH